LWPETRQLFFGPDAVHGVSRRGWRRRPGAACRQPVTTAAAEPWREGLAAFAAALAGCRGQGLRVVLSNHLVQYRVLPWRLDLESAEDYRAMAQLQFAEAFGPLADDWTITVSDEPPGVPRVAAAVPAALTAGLEAATAAAGCRLLSVQPYLAVAFNACRQRLAAAAGRWLLVHEPGRLCCGLVEAGQWRWLRQQRVADDWQRQLPALLDQETLLAGAAPAPATVLLFSPAAAVGASVPAAPGIDFVGLPGDGGFTTTGEGALAAAWLA
jgi:hypothetical protein